jgi:N-acetylmuramic acid 6-phosphate etherase
VQAIMAGGAARSSRAKRASRTTTKKARARSRAAADRSDDRHRRVGERHDAVRPRRAHARTARGRSIIFVTCDPRTELQTFVDLTISPGVGAEVIAGSTRLKAGTATKMVLNMLTTGAMVRIGKTYGNLMVDVQTGSRKLKDRARRIVNIVTGLDTTRRTSC